MTGSAERALWAMRLRAWRTGGGTAATTHLLDRVAEAMVQEAPGSPLERTVSRLAEHPVPDRAAPGLALLASTAEGPRRLVAGEVVAIERDVLWLDPPAGSTAEGLGLVGGRPLPRWGALGSHPWAVRVRRAGQEGLVPFDVLDLVPEEGR